MANLRLGVNYQSPYTAASIISHFGKTSITPCTCAYIVSEVNDQVLAITTWSEDLTNVPGYPGVIFKARTGILASRVEHPDQSKPSNMEADMLVLSEGITEADVDAGVWDHASAIVFNANYEAVNMGQIVIINGHLGQFVRKNNMITAEIQSFSGCLTVLVGNVTQNECRNDFGDERCQVDLTPFTHTGSITAVTSQTVFQDSSLIGTGADYFGNGKISFQTGDNADLGVYQVDSWDDATGEFTLRQALPYLPEVGDDLTAIRGCRKRLTQDCIAKYTNAENFNGEPFIEPMETVQRLPVVTS